MDSKEEKVQTIANWAFAITFSKWQDHTSEDNENEISNKLCICVRGFGSYCTLCCTKMLMQMLVLPSNWRYVSNYAHSKRHWNFRYNMNVHFLISIWNTGQKSEERGEISQQKARRGNRSPVILTVISPECKQKFVCEWGCTDLSTTCFFGVLVTKHITI